MHNRDTTCHTYVKQTECHRFLGLDFELLDYLYELCKSSKSIDMSGLDMKDFPCLYKYNLYLSWTIG